MFSRKYKSIATTILWEDLNAISTNNIDYFKKFVETFKKENGSRFNWKKEYGVKIFGLVHEAILQGKNEIMELLFDTGILARDILSYQR